MKYNATAKKSVRFHAWCNTHAGPSIILSVWHGQHATCKYVTLEIFKKLVMNGSDVHHGRSVTTVYQGRRPVFVTPANTVPNIIRICRHYWRKYAETLPE